VNQNKLTINSSKIQILIIPFSQKQLNFDFKIYVINEQIKIKSNAKYLGVTLEFHL